MSQELRCALLDTNTWFSEGLLHSPRGAALLARLHVLCWEVILPEVVEREVESLVARKVAEAVDRIRSEFDTVQRFLGSRDDYQVPSEGDTREAVRQRFEELRTLLRRVPFSLQHARGALTRVLAGTPPNGPKNQQFKDSAIWEALLEVAQESGIDFVTNDGGFFQGKGSDLAPSLVRELVDRAVDVRVFRGLSEYLTAIASAEPWDEAAVRETVGALISEAVHRQTQKHGLRVVTWTALELTPYATETLGRLAFDFEARFDCEPEPDQEYPPGEMVVRGSGFVGPGGEDPEEVQATEFEYLDRNGQPVAGPGGRIVYLSGHVVIGRSSIGRPPLRIPLQDE